MQKKQKSIKLKFLKQNKKYYINPNTHTIHKMPRIATEIKNKKYKKNQPESDSDSESDST